MNIFIGSNDVCLGCLFQPTYEAKSKFMNKQTIHGDEIHLDRDYSYDADRLGFLSPNEYEKTFSGFIGCCS